jgi:L-fucono-1,5-lactonase
MIIDAHHHLWKIARGDYLWMDTQANPSLAPIARDFGLEDYRALARANGIDGSVVVQAAETVAETEWLLEQARASQGLIRGVVGWVDMAASDAPEQLERLSGDRLLCGIRPMLQDISDITWVLRPELEPAFRALIDLDLAFDVLVRPIHLQDAFTALLRYPDLRAVIDHGAKPQIARGEWQPWAHAMRVIAQETGAYCKLSGLVTEASPGWTIGDLCPYVDHLLEHFGPDRLMWGSDWPVALLASDYPRWLDTARHLLAGLSESDRTKVMGGNATKFYLPVGAG